MRQKWVHFPFSRLSPAIHHCLALMHNSMKLDNVHRDSCCLKSDEKLNSQKNDKKITDEDGSVPCVMRYNYLATATKSTG